MTPDGTKTTGSGDDLDRLRLHRRLWERKPDLRAVYAVWFDRLLAGLPLGARVLEIGAGPGFLRDHAAKARGDLRFVTSDLIATGWHDVAADAARLPIRAASCDAVVGLDVLHHLPDPGGLFGEASRVIRPGGVLRFVEPWVTPFSFPIYMFFHQEDCDDRIDPWRPFARTEAQKAAFDGNAAIPKLLVEAGKGSWTRFGLDEPTVEPSNAFAYLLTLGFRERSLLPRPLVRPLLAVDRLLLPLAGHLGMRAFIAWRRSGAAVDEPQSTS